MRGIYLLLYTLIISHVLIAQSSPSDSLLLSLEDAWERANLFSKEMQIEGINSQIDNAAIADVKRSRLPQIEAEGKYGKLANIPVFVDGILEDPEFIPLSNHTTYSAGMQAYFNLYNGLKVKIAVSEAETKETIQKYITEATISEIHYRVAEYYLDILRSLEFKKIIEHNILRNTQRLQQITELYNHGVVLKSDLLRAQLQLSQQKTNLLQIKNNLSIATQKLNMLLGYSDNQALLLTDSVQLQKDGLKLRYEDFISIAVDQSPLNKIAETQVTLSELGQKNIRSDKLPQIGLYGEWIYSYPQNRWYPYEASPYWLGTAGIKISYNIASLYTNKHKAEAARLEVQKQIVACDNTQDVVRSKIKTAYSRFLEDKENIKVGKININQAEENYKIVSQTYFNKLALFTDLLEADTQLLQARFDMVNNYISERLHYYQLLKITGQL